MILGSSSVCRVAALLLAGASAALAQTPPLTPDIPPKFDEPTAGDDYVRREVMIPMRDGVKLFTVIVVPKGAQNAPMHPDPHALQRRRSARARNQSPRMLATLPQGDEVFVADGYIRVFQDVRGKYGSEGDYVMTRPLAGAAQSTPRSTTRPTPTTRSTGW